MKQLKTHQIHMLPTNGKDIAMLSKRVKDGMLQSANGKEGVANSNPMWQPQHLYITTGECPNFKNPKYNINGSKLEVWDADDMECIDMVSLKIIATTDPKLSKIGYESGKLYGVQGIEGTKFKDNRLPQPTQEFIKAYCEQGGIDEVDVEYEYHKVWDQQTEELVEKYLILKVDPIHNTITTHRIVEKMYSEKEIPQLVVDILNHLNDNQENIDSDSNLLKYVTHYIKKNKNMKKFNYENSSLYK